MVLATVLIYLVSGLVVASLVGGCFLCWDGFRGAPMDDHLHCRRCGYDLTGHVHRPEHCPECGSNTTLCGGVTIGLRRPSRSRILAGASLVMLGTMPFTLSGCLNAPAAFLTSATMSLQAPPVSPPQTPLAKVSVEDNDCCEVVLAIGSAAYYSM